jgi:hypothetical protein
VQGRGGGDPKSAEELENKGDDANVEEEWMGMFSKGSSADESVGEGKASDIGEGQYTTSEVPDG